MGCVGEALGPPDGIRPKNGRAGEGTRPYGGARRRAESSRPTGFNSGKLARQTQAQKLNRIGGNFCKPRAQWPGGNLDCHSVSLRFCAPEGSKSASGAAPVMGDPGQGEYGHASAHPEPSPVAFWLLCRRGQSNSPPGTGFVRKETYLWRRNRETPQRRALQKGPKPRWGRRGHTPG